MKTTFPAHLRHILSLLRDIRFNLCLIASMRRFRFSGQPRMGGGTALRPNLNKVFIFFTTLLMLDAPAHVFSQKAVAVTGVSITVEDLDREVEFFTQTLDFREIKREKWSGPEVAALFGLSEAGVSVEMVDLQLGTETIRLMDFDGVPSRSMPADTRSNDLWFQHLAIVVTDMDSAYQKLLSAGVTHVSTAPQTLPDYLPNAAGIKAFYFRDPEGHNLELIWFPPDNGGRPTVDGGRLTIDGENESGKTIITPDNEQGNVKNKQPGLDSDRKTYPANDLSNTVSRLPSAVNRKPSTVNRRPSTVFLGIDHTAIGISDTERSMAFYRDRLGLAHGGHSENYGTEQEHLNQVFGARLDINGLHADTGFGVELLRYIAPPGGRTYPSDSRAVDLWHYQTEIEVDRLENMIQKLEEQGFTKISRLPVKIGSALMFLLRDPDGHAVLLWQQLS